MAMAVAKSLEPILHELREEAAITRRVLDRVPADKLAWKPHSKSMSLGQLALHLASVQGNLARLLEQDEFDASQANFVPLEPKNIEEVRAAFEKSFQEAEDFLSRLNEQSAVATWRLTLGERTVLSKPRIEVMRSIMLNHCYHHRGQLSVYLRLLDTPVPVIYGRSADENPFA